MESENIVELLTPLLKREFGSHYRCENAQRLTGGASAETWRVNAVRGSTSQPLILRRDAVENRIRHISMATEASIQLSAADAGVLVPPIVCILQPKDRLGEGYLMGLVEGETLGRRIVRDHDFAGVRPQLARQCGEQLARIHALSPQQLPELPSSDYADTIAGYRETYLSFGEALPVFDYAFRWLAENPAPNSPLRLVHGDFRNGNLIVHPAQGLAAVLDWELAHLGHPLEDLGWVCINSWRFGNRVLPVGGFGELENLCNSYTAAGGVSVQPEQLHYWIVWGTLRWGIICQQQARVYLDGVRDSLEHAVIGRRVSETAMDLVNELL